MQHQLILVVGVLLSSCLPGEAQTLATQVFLAQARPEPTTMLVRALPNHFPSNVSPASRLPRTPVAQFTVLVIPAYEPDRSLESRSLVEVVRTLFVTESRLVVIQFWRGRLRLDGFDSTLHMQNVQLSPSGSGGPPPSYDQAGVASSVDLDGISLGFRFGRDAQTRRQPQVWRCLAWIMGKSRGCPL
jgi:hypothetical protein